MSWKNELINNSITWLLEEDNPNVRFLALRDLLDRDAHDPDLVEARRLAYANGPIGNVLSQMNESGFWVKAGAGYSPKYTGSSWALLLLAQLGASISMDERLQTGVNYILDHSLTRDGQFSVNGTPSGTIDCLQGNLCWALSELGCADPRLEKAFDWMARTVTGEGLSTSKDTADTRRYFAYKCGPLFSCGANNKLPCGWGGTKVLLALGNLKKDQQTTAIKNAINQGSEYFLNLNLVEANFPTRTGEKPSRDWWKFGFPVFYITDLLQIVEALVSLGLARDPRLQDSLNLIRQKQDELGRWPLEYDYAEKTWGRYGVKKEANKWVTLRALRVLKRAFESE